MHETEIFIRQKMHEIKIFLFSRVLPGGALLVV